MYIPLSTVPSAGQEALYGPTKPRDYLSGRFNPAKHPLFVRCSDLGIPTDGRTQYLRLETAEAFAKLHAAFQKDHPEISLYVTSSTRNFWYQKAIWDGKFTGKRKVDGMALNIAIPDIRKRMVKILEYSSMPGTSRHHWGTDLDINRLVNSYYEKGEGKVIYDWFVDNAPDYGFFQVYTDGRNGGYNEEKWHWSYIPVSRRLMQEWITYFGKGTSYFSGNSAFGGSEHADDFALHYVTEINPQCRN